MGWTAYNATHYNTKGQVDRIAECKDICTSSSDTANWKPLKIVQVGSTIYVAEEKTDIYGNRTVFAIVFLTKTNMKDYYNFSYKEMDETMGPGVAECPLSILNLLSDTESEYALEWRKRCLANLQKKAEKRADPHSLKNLPIGSTIEMPYWNGGTKKLTKITYHSPKTVWTDGCYRYKTKDIERQGYTVLSIASTT